MDTVIERTTSEEQILALENLPKVEKLVRSLDRRSDTITVQVDNHELVSLNLPIKLFNVLQTILDLMSKGKAFSLMPANAELTTQEAADLLNVSRPFVVKLLKENVLSYKQVGTHRRIPVEELMRYLKIMKRDRKNALDEIAGLGQEYNI